MIEYFKENRQLYGIFLFWILMGVFTGPGIYLIVPFTVLLMMYKGMTEEFLMCYFFILILSDSFYEHVYFAKDVKNIYILLMAYQFFFNTKQFYPLNRLYKLFMPFFIFSLIPLLLSVQEPFFFTGFQKTLSYFFTFLLIPSYIEKLYRENGPAFLRRLILFCFTTLVLGFVLKYVAPDIAYLSSGRYRGIMGNPNGLGIYAFLIFILFFLINEFFPKLFSQNERFVIYAVIVLSIFMTDSRNSLIAAFLFYVFQKFFRSSQFLGIIVMLILVLVTQIINANIVQIIMALHLEGVFRLETLENASGRYIAWNFAWREVQNNLFLGRGFAYDEYFMLKHYDELSMLGHQGGVHNSFLSFWMNLGIIGLLIFLRSYILMFILAGKKTKLALPVMFTIFFTAFFESWLVGSLSAFAFLGITIYTVITSDEILPEEVNDQLVA